MKTYRELLHNLLRDDSGQDMIEYALIAGVISLAGISLFSGIAGSIKTVFTNIGTQLTNATAT